MDIDIPLNNRVVKSVKKTRRGGVKFKEKQRVLKRNKKHSENKLNGENASKYKKNLKSKDIIQITNSKLGIRKIPVPPNRLSPLKKSWEQIVMTVVEKLGLEIRMNTHTKNIEIRKPREEPEGNDIKNAIIEGMDLDGPSTSQLVITQEDENLLQKASDYIRAFTIGFDLKDAEAILRLEDIFLETFQIQDVKRLTGDHLSRCIGRLSGREGRTKHSIENATRTRIVIAGNSIHILGSFSCIAMARHSICSLILGTPPSKVYNQLRTISKRLKERL